MVARREIVTHNPMLQAIFVILPMIITGAFGYLIAITQNDGQQQTTEHMVAAQLVQSLITRVNDLELKNAELGKQITVQSGEIMALRAAANTGETNQRALLRGMLNSLAGPAWVKRVVEDANGNVIFINYLVNRAYEERFEVTAARYYKKTDAQIWKSKEAVANFRDTDLWVWTNKQNLETVVEFPENANRLTPEGRGLKQHFVWKGLIRLGNKQWGIAGLTFEHPNEMEPAQIRGLLQ